MDYNSIEYYESCGWGDRAEDFRNFMKAVDRECLILSGVGIYDIPDWDFASAFEDEQDPEEVAREALAEAGWSA